MFRSACLTVAITIVGAALSAAPAQPGSDDAQLPELLERLGHYVTGFERDLAAVVSEEDYLQEVHGGPAPFGDQRSLRSDLLLSMAGNLGWVGFRDVFEVDGKPVRDRNDRLVDLFLKPTADSGNQVRRLVDESARLNLGWVNRTINVPTMALQFARSADQHRSEFTLSGTTKVKSTTAREIHFREIARPRVIKTDDWAAAAGRFWIEEDSGRVVRTELRFTTVKTTVSIVVTYEFQPRLNLLLPVLMEEQYSTPLKPTIIGRASYKNFRQFNVTVEQIIK
jgi:hypothetical protein